MKNKPWPFALTEIALVVTSFLAIIYCADPHNRQSMMSDVITAIFIFASILLCGLTVIYSLKEWYNLQSELQRTRQHYKELLDKPRRTR